MSHFSVLVLTSTESLDELEAALEPYDENRDVEPYRRYVAPDPEDWNRRLAARAGVDPLDDAAVLVYLRANDPDTTFGIDDHGLYEVSDVNPDGHWDYWVIGGRWSGLLVSRPGRQGLAAPDAHRSIFATEAPTPGTWDRIRKADLDIEGMRERAATAANAKFERIQTAVAAFGPLPASDDPDWREHPTITALLLDPEFDDLEMATRAARGRDYVLNRARLGVLPGFATVVDGEWISPGRVGWWGTTDAQSDDYDTYYARVNRIIDDADDSVVFTLVDCHS